MATRSQIKELREKKKSLKGLRKQLKGEVEGNSNDYRALMKDAKDIGLTFDQYLRHMCPDSVDPLTDLLTEEGIVKGAENVFLAELNDYERALILEDEKRSYNNAVLGKGVYTGLAARGAIQTDEDKGTIKAYKGEQPEQRSNVFTQSQFSPNTSFNPYTQYEMILRDPVVNPVSADTFVGGNVNVTGTHVTFPEVTFEDKELKTRNVPELGEIPMVTYTGQETQEKLWKYATGLQRSYESDMIVGSTQMRNIFLAMAGAQRNVDLLKDGLESLIKKVTDYSARGKRNKTGGTHSIAAAGSANKWTLDKWLTYLKRWNGEFTPDWIVATPASITKLEQMAWTETNNAVQTVAQYAVTNPGVTTVPRPARATSGLQYIDLEGIEGLDDNKYLFIDTRLAMLMISNPALEISESDRNIFIQANYDVFSFSARMIQLFEAATELVTLA